MRNCSTAPHGRLDVDSAVATAIPTLTECLTGFLATKLTGGEQQAIGGHLEFWQTSQGLRITDLALRDRDPVKLPSREGSACGRRTEVILISVDKTARVVGGPQRPARKRS
jgi:hypothetical protein